MHPYASTHHPAHAGPPGVALQSRSLAVRGSLRPYVTAIVALELGRTGPVSLAIAPHESMVLSVQIGRGVHAIERKGELGELTRLTGIREWTGRFKGMGDCVTLQALLTPLGAVHVLQSQALATQPRIQARIDGLLDRKLTRQLESDIALACTLDDKLQHFAAWLESHLLTQRQFAPGALRAGRAAMRLSAEPHLTTETLAGEQHICRRQLERDFRRFLGTSPLHLARVARVQAVSRRGQTGASLADIAADIGFADQAHMSRVVHQLTGLTPRRFVRAAQSPMGATFRHATSGATVYL